MKFYAAAHFPISKILENGCWKIGEKTRGRAEFHGPEQNFAYPRVFQSIFQDFGNRQIHCPNQPRYVGLFYPHSYVKKINWITKIGF